MYLGNLLTFKVILEDHIVFVLILRHCGYLRTVLSFEQGLKFFLLRFRF